MTERDSTNLEKNCQGDQLIDFWRCNYYLQFLVEDETEDDVLVEDQTIQHWQKIQDIIRDLFSIPNKKTKEGKNSLFEIGKKFAGMLPKMKSATSEVYSKFLNGKEISEQSLFEMFERLSPHEDYIHDLIEVYTKTGHAFGSIKDNQPLLDIYTNIFEALHSKIITEYCCIGNSEQGDDIKTDIESKHKIFTSLGKKLYEQISIYTKSKNPANPTDFDKNVIRETMKLLALIGVVNDIRKTKDLVIFKEALSNIFEISDYTDEIGFWKKLRKLKYLILSKEFSRKELYEVIRQDLIYESEKELRELAIHHLELTLSEIITEESQQSLADHVRKMVDSILGTEAKNRVIEEDDDFIDKSDISIDRLALISANYLRSQNSNTDNSKYIQMYIKKYIDIYLIEAIKEILDGVYDKKIRESDQNISLEELLVFMKAE